ncbi:MAG: hypothetical protein ACT4N8_04455 [Sphingosinicella sp.]|uniref:hypothetical protein n=1 Tax=Sphingosinicella sp. TaxID=1917971 RepID=UPI004037FDC8
MPASALAQSAPPADPAALIEAQRRELLATIRPACPAAGPDAEIVVCGRRDEDRYRVPVTVAPGSAPAAAGAGGEQRAALAIDTSRCTTVGRDAQCTGGLDAIGIGTALVRAVGQALANRD